MSIVSSEWLNKNIDKVKIIDCSWHMPSENRNSLEEYKNDHIVNAIFFDLEKNSDLNSNLPHMLTDKNSWEKIVSKMGIFKNDNIIVYDNSDVLSACRCWYNFIYFGHDPNLIHVLDGGLKKWKMEKKSTTNKITDIKTSSYIAKENKELVKNKNQIDQNIINKKFEVLDARSRGRFEGRDPEPRKELRSGSIPNSMCLPYKECINNDNSFKKINELKYTFEKILGPKLPTNVVFSCGSGVTASVLALAYSLINNKYLPRVYDGSWAEYGRIKK